jgi:molecular chaperone HscB
MDDYFAVFGLPRKLGLDAEDLRRRFYELSREHHPDFHQSAGADVQAGVLARSALVNRAYRALRDPMGRIEYLVALEEGREGADGGAAKARVPVDLLEEMMEVQETLQEARAIGLDGGARERLRTERQRLLARDADEARAILDRAPEWDAVVDAGGDRRPLIGWFKEKLATRAYLRTVIDDLSGALGEPQERHVSHRRH